MDQKNILVVLCAVLLVVFVVLGVVIIAKNNQSGSAGLLDSLKNMFGGSSAVKKNETPTTARPVASGKITAVDGNTITVQGAITMTYKIDASSVKITKGYGKNVQNLSASDIKPDDVIQIFGTISANPISITSITDNGNPLEHFSFSGNVTAVNGNSFIIERQNLSANGSSVAAPVAPAVSYTIKTTSSTIFMKDGKTSSISDVTNGEMIIAIGAVDQASKTITADNVNINTHPLVAPAVKNTKK